MPLIDTDTINDLILSHEQRRHDCGLLIDLLDEITIQYGECPERAEEVAQLWLERDSRLADIIKLRELQ